jgi:long-chain acyl-CoA synthetase
MPITKISPQRLLHESLFVTAEKYPDKTAVFVEGNPYTYGELLDSALRLAGSLVKRGVQRGDRVAIYMDNTWECVVSIYAILFAGGVFIVVNQQTKADKLQYILNDSEAVILIADSSLGRIFVSVLDNLRTLNFLIFSGSGLDEKITNRGGKNITFESFSNILDDSVYMKQDVNVISVDMAALIYTSGSTGDPKGVMHTHQSMVFAMESLIEYLRLSHTHRILCVLPLAFDYGLYQLLMSVKVGATLVLERSFTYPAQVFKRIEELAVTVFPGVPTIFAMIFAAHSRKSLYFPTITRVTNTAAALPAEYVPRLAEIFPEALIYKMYGLTECKRVCYLEPELVQKKSTSVGKAIPGTEVFILSKEGKPVSPGEPGILYVRGPHIMKGYWKNEISSAHMLKEGNVPGEKILCTHDWFRMDEDGFLYFIGRDDDIIKTRGEKVSPVEVENVLHGIEGVKDAAIIGVPDEVLGESIRAFVSLKKGAEIGKKEIQRECISKLENYMVPKEIIILQELPKTNTEKISKKMLAEINIINGELETSTDN